MVEVIIFLVESLTKFKIECAHALTLPFSVVLRRLYTTAIQVGRGFRSVFFCCGMAILGFAQVLAIIVNGNWVCMIFYNKKPD